ncbi:sigma-54 dependent transcriptional regulator [Halorhodospira sp. 9622]|uniref:sigma-54 dependent transcriptional regulator n=1 Tax=Halorhodospira sp. 9622 TaxID=2899136 RepID=UPI001EE9476F|nr:sigma-54 dependent transcriptional regulator [Halorhodospira sp. 9622]MCG5538688.1 sigma-54 dependent transcriptional regulator [Halorhodospira sp. 9622]
MGQQRVLVVAREPGRRSEQRRRLDDAGFVTAEAEDTGSAHELLEQGGITAVVCFEDAGDGDNWRVLTRHPMAPPVIVISARAEVSGAVAAMRDGAADYVAEEAPAGELAAAVARVTDAGPELVAEDRSSRQLMALAQRVAGKDVTVLLTGESGTGKEIFARYIHERSPRADGPFIAVNCAAIPENMLEALLFGFEKGAFTGANRAHAGKFEQAQGGTLLLDEVSEIEPGLQAKLLRALQEKEIERLCGQTPIPLDVRVLASSNRDLREAVRNGRFREDLFYRLHVFPIHLPPLRERAADIIPLARSFAQKYAQLGGGCGADFTPEAERLLIQHPWPGNVRELENVVQRALILAEGSAIDAEAIRFEPVTVSAGADAPSTGESAGASAPVAGVAAAEGTPGPAVRPEAAAGQGAAATLEEDLKSREYRRILETLDRVGGNRKEAAARLGISSRTLRYKLARMRQEGVEIPERSGMLYAYGN